MKAKSVYLFSLFRQKQIDIEKHSVPLTCYVDAGFSTFVSLVYNFTAYMMQDRFQSLWIWHSHWPESELPRWRSHSKWNWNTCCNSNLGCLSSISSFFFSFFDEHRVTSEIAEALSRVAQCGPKLVRTQGNTALCWPLKSNASLRPPLTPMRQPPPLNGWVGVRWEL